MAGTGVDKLAEHWDNEHGVTAANDYAREAQALVELAASDPEAFETAMCKAEGRDLDPATLMEMASSLELLAIAHRAVRDQALDALSGVDDGGAAAAEVLRSRIALRDQIAGS